MLTTLFLGSSGRRSATLLVFRASRFLLFLLVMEEASEDGVAGQDAARSHRFIHASRHLKHAVAIASVNNQVEDLGVRQAHALSLQLTDHLQQLIRSE